MYGAGDALSRVYTEGFRTQLYSERVVLSGRLNKVVVAAREDDDATMLNHALIRGRRRHPTRRKHWRPPAPFRQTLLDGVALRGLPRSGVAVAGSGRHASRDTAPWRRRVADRRLPG